MGTKAATRGARVKVFAALTLALLTGCAARKPAAAQAHLVAPPRCVQVMARTAGREWPA
jgi:hypothetical protein